MHSRKFVKMHCNHLTELLSTFSSFYRIVGECHTVRSRHLVCVTGTLFPPAADWEKAERYSCMQLRKEFRYLTQVGTLFYGINLDKPLSAQSTILRSDQIPLSPSVLCLEEERFLRKTLEVNLKVLQRRKRLPGKRYERTLE